MPEFSNYVMIALSYLKNVVKNNHRIKFLHKERKSIISSKREKSKFSFPPILNKLYSEHSKKLLKVINS